MKRMGKYLIFFELIYFPFASLLLDFGLSRAVFLPLYLANLALLAVLLLSKEKNRLRPARNVLIAMGVWLGYMLVSAVFRKPDPLRMIYSVHLWCQGIVLFCACFVFLDRRDMAWMMRMLDAAYICHCLLVCVQYFVFHKTRDNLGGIFGCQMGCNAPNNIFLILIVIRALCRCNAERRLTPYFGFVQFSAMIIAGLSELKFFYYCYPVIVALVTLLFMIARKAELKTVLLVLLCAAGAYAVGLWVLYQLFPTHFMMVVGERSLAEYEEGVRSPYMLSRSRFISEINDQIFHGALPLNLTGVGLGNSEQGSAFFKQYGDLNYQYFSSQYMFIEGGLVGMLLFTAIPLVSCVEHGLALLRKKEIEAHAIGCVFSLLMAVVFYYNNSYNSDTSYLIYAALSIGYILAGSKMAAAETERR